MPLMEFLIIRVECFSPTALDALFHQRHRNIWAITCVGIFRKVVGKNQHSLMGSEFPLTIKDDFYIVKKFLLDVRQQYIIFFIISTFLTHYYKICVCNLFC
jgi:hypothetical protein